MSRSGTIPDRIAWLEAEIADLKRRATLAVGMPPSVHSPNHEDGGSDPLDITTLGGFPDDPDLVLLGDGTFGAPPAGAGEPAPVYHGSSGASLTLDWTDSRKHFLELTDDVALTLSNPTDGGAYVVVIDTGAGGFTPTWPGSVRWPDDTPPDVTAVDVAFLVTLLYRDDLGVYLGSFNGPYAIGT